VINGLLSILFKFLAKFVIYLSLFNYTYAKYDKISLLRYKSYYTVFM